MIRLLATGLLLTFLPVAAGALPQTVNLSRYVLGVDVPESPALVGLDSAPPVRLGSAPKPVAASLLVGASGKETFHTAAWDVSPYYLVAGVRNLESYRSNSVSGRLLRVLTKTIVSVGVLRSDADPGDLEISMGARATIHDPHDPVLNSLLPEEVADALTRAGISPGDPGEEDLTDRGVDLTPEFARARRRMRARGGDSQVSLGLASAKRSRGGAFSADSLGSVRRAAWATWQYTCSLDFDFLTTVQWSEGGGSESRWTSIVGVKHKGAFGDLTVGFRYDTRARLFQPSTAVDARLGTRTGMVLWVDTDADRYATNGDRPLRVGVLLRWFVAVDPA